MYGYNVPAFEDLIEQFELLPGIGKKSATRLAHYVLNLSQNQAEKFSATILDVRKKIRYCDVCFNMTDSTICSICKDNLRDQTIVCVVENSKDIVAFEKIGEFSGLYHVLNGTISPMHGVGPDQLRIKELLSRIQKNQINEVIMATNPTVEGEATAMYVAKILKPLGIKVTRIAYGIPVGGDLEYADEITLQRSFLGRCEI